MGSYSSFRVGKYELYSVKNDIDPLLMSLFRPSDKEVRKTRVTNTLTEHYDRTGELDDLEEVTVVQYRTTLKVMRDRLELMGFTIDYCRIEFDNGIKQYLNQIYDEQNRFKSLEEFHRQEREVLERLGFDVWLDGIRRIWQNNLKKLDHLNTGISLLEDFPVIYMLQKDLLYGFYGFPTNDVRVFLRAIFNVLPSDLEVAQDLTDLVLGGWYDTDDELCAYSDYLVTADFLSHQRIIVLTEGPSDKRVIEGALEVLYPHLKDYFTFMDFEQMNVPGGASFLVSFVKAFVAAGILNRIVALFDNDTAARSALRVLNNLSLPDNIRVLQYPNIKIAENYPTLGPAGILEMDINGLATSIELYFGEDVLRQEDGILTPVQWRGYDTALKQYQGEIINKLVLQERFSNT